MAKLPKESLQGIFKEVYSDTLNDLFEGFTERNNNDKEYGIRLTNKQLYKMFGSKEEFEELVKTKVWKLTR